MSCRLPGPFHIPSARHRRALSAFEHGNGVGYLRHLRRLRITLSILPSALILTANAAVAQVRAIEVSGDPQCAECRIELEHVVTIGDVNDEHLYRQFSTLVRGPGPTYYVANGYTPGVVLVYDSAGRLIRTIGRPGQGPGEIAGQAMIHVTAEDSIQVVSGGRVTVFSTSAGDAARSWNLGVSSWGLDGLEGGITAAVLAPNARQETVRIFDPDGSHRASIFFEGAPEHPDQLAGRAYSAGDTLLLVSATGRYRIRAFDADARLRWTLEREVDWFQPYARQPRGAIFQTPSLPDAISAWVESNRYLWVLIERPPQNWRPAEPGTAPDRMDLNEVLGSHLEVIDLQTGRVLASQRMPWLIPAAPGQPFLYSPRLAATGTAVFDVWRVVLVRPSEGRDR